MRYSFSEGFLVLTLRCLFLCFSVFFFFNDTATTEIYTLSLHDALPICCATVVGCGLLPGSSEADGWRSEEHTSELQSRQYLVCRLLLEKKKKKKISNFNKKKKIKKKIIKNKLIMR